MARYRCKGTKILVDKTGSGTYTQIIQATSIDPGGVTTDEVDDTDLDSEGREFSPALPDPGTVTVELRYDPADVNHSYLRTWADAPTNKPVRIRFPTLPDATLSDFTAYPSSFVVNGGQNQDPLTATVEFRVSGVRDQTTEEEEP